MVLRYCAMNSIYIGCNAGNSCVGLCLVFNNRLLCLKDTIKLFSQLCAHSHDHVIAPIKHDIYVTGELLKLLLCRVCKHLQLLNCIVLLKEHVLLTQYDVSSLHLLQVRKLGCEG